MSIIPSFNSLYEKQSAKFTRATFKKGIINRVNLSSNTVDVQIIGNQSTVIKGVPMASTIDPTLVPEGAKCRLDLFDETNPNDMVIAYIYGISYAPRKSYYASGSHTVSNGTTFPVNIAHGLGVAPTIYYGIVSNIYSGQVYTAWVNSADATNLVVQASTSSFPISVTVYWYAYKPAY
jgi:hypothetical protein